MKYTHMQHTHTYTYIHIYIYIHTYIYIHDLGVPPFMETPIYDNVNSQAYSASTHRAEAPATQEPQRPRLSSRLESLAGSFAGDGRVSGSKQRAKLWWFIMGFTVYETYMGFHAMWMECWRDFFWWLIKHLHTHLTTKMGVDGIKFMLWYFMGLDMGINIKKNIHQQK